MTNTKGADRGSECTGKLSTAHAELLIQVCVTCPSCGAYINLFKEAALRQVLIVAWKVIEFSSF